MNDVSGEILADAGRLISSDRAEQHGDMRANHENLAKSLLKIARTKTGNPRYNNLPPIVVPFPMRALEPWTTGEAERSPEAMVLLYRVQEAGSPMNCAA